MKLDPTRILHLETLAARYTAEVRGLQVELEALDTQRSNAERLRGQLEENIRRSAEQPSRDVYMEGAGGAMHVVSAAASQAERAATATRNERRRAEHAQQVRAVDTAINRTRERLSEAIQRADAAKRLHEACREHLDQHGKTGNN